METNNPYKPRTFKPKAGDEKVLNFLDTQGNVNDCIRYLIQKEIYENGIRNLEEFIPSKRSDMYFSSICSKHSDSTSAYEKPIVFEEKKEITTNKINEPTNENNDEDNTKELSLDSNNDKTNEDNINSANDKDTEKISNTTDETDNDSSDDDIPSCYE